MRGAEHHPDGVGHHEPYKAHQPAQGDSRSGEECPQRDDEQLVALHLHPQERSALFSHREGVQNVGEEPGGQHSPQDQGRLNSQYINTKYERASYEKRKKTLQVY